MNGKKYTQTDKLTFGKYKGKTIREVLQIDADYIKWCQDNVKGFSMDEEPGSDATVKASFYSEGVEILDVNPWAHRCFCNAKRMAEDVGLVIEAQPDNSTISRQLQLIFV